MAKLPAGYRIEMAGSIEESAKANVALAAVFPIMVALMLTIIMFQVRSFSATSMVMLTAPLGLIGAVPVLLLFHQPFGFNAILGLIGLAGILMRNTLILIGQIQTNQQHGLDPYHAVVEATVQRARPVILTALAAVLAFIPLTQFGVLGLDGLYADRRHGRRHRSDLGFPAGALRDLVPREAAGGRQSGLRETADRASDDAECQSLRCGLGGHWVSLLKPTAHGLERQSTAKGIDVHEQDRSWRRARHGCIQRHRTGNCSGAEARRLSAVRDQP